MTRRVQFGLALLLLLSLTITMVILISIPKHHFTKKHSSFIIRLSANEIYEEDVYETGDEKINKEIDDFNPDVRADRWIVVDGTNIPEDYLVNLEDVTGWRILVFGKDSSIFRGKRCTNCIALNTVSQLSTNPTVLEASNIKMMSYLFAIGHGAKWIYVTNHITSLKNQVQAFNTDSTTRGLFYTGNTSFDSDRHFGVKDVSPNHHLRDQQSSFRLGVYLTSTVQSRWQPPEPGTHKKEIRRVACRIPHVIVPSQLSPSTDLMGSLIERRSFWVLGSLISEMNSPSFSYWWLWLMRALNEVIDIYPPLCGDESSVPATQGRGSSHSIPNILKDWRCDVRRNFYKCGIRLGEILVNENIIPLSSDFEPLIKKWFKLLAMLNYHEPKISESKKAVAGGGHKVRLEPLSIAHTENHIVKNSFKFCKQPVSKISKIPPVQDILAIIVYNFHTYYSNFIYYDEIYRKYFTNIIYCGSKLDKFSVELLDYHRPVSFLELGVTELSRGIRGYLCAATAMEMGFRVDGYLHLADDILFNVWNVINLPRDRNWFQSSIRNGTLAAQQVPNIASNEKSKTWWVWSNDKLGIVNLKRALSALREFMDTPNRSRVVSFFKQLNDSFGRNAPGVFYEASDIFYVSDKFRNDFNFLSKQFSRHRVHLEMAVPTMLCGLDHINNIVRLNGSYLWHEESEKYMPVYSPTKNFIHPWKITKHLKHKAAQYFFCKNYLPYVNGKPLFEH